MVEDARQIVGVSSVVGDGNGRILLIRTTQAGWELPAGGAARRILFIETWFNPHFGVYWVFDVERERVILSEIQNDGLDAWRQCHEGKRIEKQ